MKNIFKILSFAILISFVCACDTKQEGPITSDIFGVSFLSAKMNVEFDKKATSFTVPIARANASAEETIGLTNNLGLVNPRFNVPANVTFAQGEAQKDIVITFDPANINPGTDYTFKIEAQAAASPGGVDSIVVTTVLKLVFEKYAAGMGTYISRHGVFNKEGQTEAVWDSVVIEKAKDLEIYRFSNFLKQDFHILFKVSEDGSIVMDYKPTGLATPHGMVFMGTIPGKPSKKEGDVFTLYTRFGIPKANHVFPSSGIPDVFTLWSAAPATPPATK